MKNVVLPVLVLPTIPILIMGNGFHICVATSIRAIDDPSSLIIFQGIVYSENPSRFRWRPMPSEITSTDKFVTLSEGALECRVKRSKDVVKLKLRTPRQLFTYKVKVDRADDVLRRLKCEVVEV